MILYEIATGQPVKLAERPNWPLSTGQLVQAVDDFRAGLMG